MAVREIVVFPDPVLREISTAVESIDDEVRQLVADMQETMYYKEGAGLAAIQVGVRRRIFIADPVLAGGTREEPTLVFINPEIIAAEGDQEGDEGCLSFPGVFIHAKRPESVKVTAHDRHGNEFSRDTTGNDLLSLAVQHENDHLAGVLMLEYADKRGMKAIRAWAEGRGVP